MSNQSFQIVDVEKNKRDFDGFPALIAFLKSEKQAIEEIRNMDPTAEGSHITALLKIGNRIGSVIETAEQLMVFEIDKDETGYNRQIAQLKTDLGALSWATIGPFREKWLEVSQLGQAVGDAFYGSIIHNQCPNLNSFSAMQGCFLAYEFLHQADSELVKRRSAEKRSIARLRADFEGRMKVFSSDADKLESDTSSRFEEKAADLDEEFNQLHTSHTSTNAEIVAKIDEAYTKWTKKIIELEAVYKEKLRFDSPAAYWSKKAIQYRDQGLYWTLALILASGVAILSLYLLIIDWISGAGSHAVSLATVPGLVLFIALISAFVILVKTFSRLAFSAFHLQRDAEEREQLTHLYLSLGNETEMDGESRTIILQALFSRSESGLLANESGPTMPGVHEIVSTAVRGR